jgi:outer membrane immunogenic protein
MKKSLGALVALVAMPVAGAYAADLPAAQYYKAPPPAQVVYNWTGFYLGGEVGGGWAQSTTTEIVGSGGFPNGFSRSPVNESGVLGGGYAGYNYQFNNNIVVGIDGYYDGAGLTGNGTDVSPTTGHISSSSEKMKWDSAITGRLGYANNNWLFFVKGGWAWAGFSGNTVTTTAAGAAVGSGGSSDTRDGATVGVGLEYGFLPHWSAKLEYDYVKFETANFNASDVNATTGVATSPARSATSDLNEFKAGVAYRF